eukprot:3600650-Pyramimonas_sp.AAC.1
MLTHALPCLVPALRTQALQTPLKAPPSVFCNLIILSGAGSSFVTFASLMGRKYMGGPPMGSSGRAGGIAADSVSRPRPAPRCCLGELRGGGTERPMEVSSGMVGGRRSILFSVSLSFLPSPAASAKARAVRARGGQACATTLWGGWDHRGGVLRADSRLFGPGGWASSTWCAELACTSESEMSGGLPCARPSGSDPLLDSSQSIPS